MSFFVFWNLQNNTKPTTDNLYAFLFLILVDILDIVDPTPKSVDELKKLNLPAGVDITVKI